MPKISVIIPVYKVEKYLPACLDSVLAQKFTDWEAICVNDGSPDNCAKILQEYAEKDKRIKVIAQKNQGLSMTRNNGLKVAAGEYVLFLDSDDYIHPQLLDICYTLVKKENADMVAFGFQNGQRGEVISMPNYEIENIRHIVTHTPLYYQTKRHKHKISMNAWSKLYKKDLIKDLLFIPGITMEDYPYTYAVLAKKPKTVILDIPLYYYILNPESISATDLTVKKIKDYQIGLNFIINLYEKASKKEKYFVLHQLFPNILKQQLNKILCSSKEKQKELYDAFAQELRDLKEKGWLKPWGHKISRYLTYRQLIRRGGR